MSQASYDVVVIGYGPTGVTAANLLGAAGLQVAVVERDLDVFIRARAISTDEEVLRIWQRIGLADRLGQDMLTGLPMQFVDNHGKPFLTVQPTSRGHGHPPQTFIYQPALEQVLRDGVDRYPNVTVLLEHECTAVTQDDAGAQVTIRDTSSGADAGSTRTLQAAYVIAADGGSSATRAGLDVGYEGRTFSDRWVVIDTEMLTPWPAHDRLRFHCDPTRPAVDCPTPLGHHRWEFPILPGEDEAELVSDAAVWRLLARYGIDRGNVRILRAVVYSHHVRIAARWRVGRVFLAGDAAHAMPPWIGQGMAAGVRDVANLSWKLAAVCRGQLPAAVLDSYETERQPHLREVTRRAVFVGRIITERRGWVTRVRNPLFRVGSRIGPLNTYFQQSNWIPFARYGDGYLATAPGSKATGHHLPQPFVMDPDGRRVRLDDAITALSGAAPGTAWTLLTAETAAPAGNPAGRAHPAWTDAGVTQIRLLPTGSDPAGGAIVDIDGELTDWLTAHHAATVALRPDGYIYAAVERGPLPPPPTGFAPARSSSTESSFTDLTATDAVRNP